MVDFESLTLAQFSPSTFSGLPPPQRYIVHGRLPRGKVVLLAGRGGEGKSYLLLELFNAINNGGGGRVFGGDVFGISKPCIILAGEDDRDEVCRRLHSIGVKDLPDMGGIVTVPDVGSMSLVALTYGTDEIESTPAYNWLDNVLDQQRILHGDLGFVAIDPASVFLPVDGNSASQVQGAVNLLSQLARKHDVTIILVQHLNKVGAGNGELSAEAVRNAVKGSASWIDAVRAAYGLWKVPSALAKQMKDTLGNPDGDILCLGLLKANGEIYRSNSYLLRQDNGTLLDVTVAVADNSVSAEEALLQVVKEANGRGKVLNKTGTNGLYNLRSSGWAQSLQKLSKSNLEALAQRLIDLEKLTVSKGQGLIAIGTFTEENG